MSQAGNKKTTTVSTAIFLFCLSKSYNLPSNRTSEINNFARTLLRRKSIVFRFVLPPLSLILS